MSYREPQDEIDEQLDGIAHTMWLYRMGFINEQELIRKMGQFQFRMKNVVLEMHAIFAPEDEDGYDYI